MTETEDRLHASVYRARGDVRTANSLVLASKAEFRAVGDASGFAECDKVLDEPALPTSSERRGLEAQNPRGFVTRNGLPKRVGGAQGRV